MPDADPAPLRARPVRRLPRDRRASRRTRRPRPSSRCGSRSTTGAGPACRSSSAPARRCRSRRPRSGSSSSSPPRLGIGGRMVPDPDELILRIKPEPGAELCLLAKKRGRRRAAARPPRPAVRGAGRRAARALRAAARDALRGDPSRFPDQDAIEETWRIVQPLLDDPRRARALRAGQLGARVGEPAAQRPRRLARALAAETGRPPALSGLASNSSEAPIAPPRSPSSATVIAGGRSSTNRCLCIALARAARRRARRSARRARRR